MYKMSEKYNNDPAFKMLVDMMENFMHKHEYTPSEMREAAVLASINFEMRRVHKIIYLDPKTEEALKILRDDVIDR